MVKDLSLQDIRSLDKKNILLNVVYIVKKQTLFTEVISNS